MKNGSVLTIVKFVRCVQEMEEKIGARLQYK